MRQPLRQHIPTFAFAFTCACTCAGVLVASAPAAADSIILPVTVVERGIDSFPIDGVFIGPQFDPGQATITKTTFEERTLLEFNLSSLPADAIITAATLQLTLTGNFQGQSGELHGYVGNGVYDNADLAIQNLLTAFTISSSGTALNLSVPIAFIQARLTAGDQFAGFTLRNTTQPGGVFSIWTDATSLQNVHPTLAIETEAATVVPEPSSVLLTAGGLLLLLTTARKSASAIVHGTALTLEDSLERAMPVTRVDDDRF